MMNLAHSFTYDSDTVLINTVISYDRPSSIFTGRTDNPASSIKPRFELVPPNGFRRVQPEPWLIISFGEFRRIVAKEDNWFRKLSIEGSKQTSDLEDKIELPAPLAKLPV
jgi:hypothetical protein